MRKLENSELERLSVEGFKAVEKTPLIVVLDNIRSLNNIGSVFRTSDAFRIEKIYLCGITATPPHKDIQKTALGSTDLSLGRMLKAPSNLFRNYKPITFKFCPLSKQKMLRCLMNSRLNPTKLML